MLRIVGCLVLAVVSMACASIRVDHDYDRAFDFGQVRTYDFYPEMKSGLSPLDQKRIIVILEHQFSAMGWKQDADPQIYVNLDSEVFREVSPVQLGVGIGGTGNQLGGAVGVDIPMGDFSSGNLKARITFDLVDAAQMELVWQAVTVSAYFDRMSPEERELWLKKVVDKAFEGFPLK